MRSELVSVAASASARPSTMAIKFYEKALEASRKIHIFPLPKLTAKIFMPLHA